MSSEADIMGAVLLSCAALGFARMFLDKYLEVDLINESLKSGLNRSPKYSSLKSKQIKTTFRLIEALRLKLEAAEEKRSSIAKVLNLSNGIGDWQALDKKAAQEVAETILTQAKPGVKAVAMVYKSQDSGNLEAQSLIGRIKDAERVKPVVLKFVDALCCFEKKNSHNWGYFTPKRGSFLDLSTFDIGTFFCLPFKEK